MIDVPLIEWLAKRAASGRKTGKSVRVALHKPGGAAAVSQALHDDAAPASHQPSARYGRTPYVRRDPKSTQE